MRHDKHSPKKPTRTPKAKAKPHAKKPSHKTKHPTRGHQAHAHPAHERRAKKPSRKSVWIMRGAAGLVALLVIVVVAVLVLNKTHGTNKDQQALKKQVAKGPQLEVVTVKKAPTEHELVLEAESRPYYQATIFAKVSGYLKEIRVIEGSRVKKGEIMAVIDSPETDQAYEAARADAINKNRIAQRNRVLLKQKLISPQEGEQAFADARMATANLRSAREQKDYEFLRAPFDGIVTARLVDPGALIPNASNAKTAQLAVVNLSDTSHLKIDAFVEQRYASDVIPGMPVELYLPDKSSQRYPAKVARVSGVLDPRTRMLFVEMDFDNSNNQIVAGSFVSVSIKVQRPELLQAPVLALISKNDSPALATVGQDNKIHLQPVQIFENDGSNVMISQGAREGQRIALNVGAELKDGDQIQAIDSDKKQKPNQFQAQSASANGTVSGTTQPPPQAAAPSQQAGKPPQGQQQKQVDQSGESQPKRVEMPPSKSNTTYLPKPPPEPNE